MNWIKKLIGIKELIDKQEEANKLISELIRIGKHSIDNDMKSHSEKQSYHSFNR